MELHRPCSALKACIARSHKKCVITGKVVVQQSQGRSGPGKSTYIQVYSSTEVDPKTRKGKLSEKARLKHGKSKTHNGTKTITYKIKLHVEAEFGTPGAIVMTNQHKHEFYLESATLEAQDQQIIHFNCRSWVYPIQKTKSERLFFSNTSYLPNQTPIALVELRNSELLSLRGNGTGERKEWDRIYDYDFYNDLGSPNKGQKYTRPVLGGSQLHPYPRRGRTSFPPSSNERWPKKMNLDVRVPPDDRLSPRKFSEIISNSVKAAVNHVIPEAKYLVEQEQDTSAFKSFDEIHDMLAGNKSPAIDRKLEEKLKKFVPDELFVQILHASKETIKKCPLPMPQIITENEFSWKDDDEFGRQMIAGINPTRVQCLQRFPPEGKDGTSAIRASDIEHNLDGLNIIEAMQQWRILILDDHEYLMPFLDRINTGGICAYASRTLFFLRDDATLKPIAIELSLPASHTHDRSSQVFLPANQGTEAALWQLAKAHVAANDSAYHQLISHWLCTHAVVEPFIIATRRQLSVMHPIYRLLGPHLKDTMHINALARSILINSGGMLERALFTGQTSMELSSELYKNWRFDEQALPADLIKRRLALQDPDSPAGIQLLFEDYPYGADGLEIWCAIRTWVTEFCSIFYKDNDAIKDDIEIQEWWSEIKNIGHGDKCNETWWYEMTTLSNLIEALTTLIWISSAFHAAVNFGQFAYASYPPNRPMLCRKFIPREGEKKFGEFLKNPDKYYLDMLPGRFQTSLGIALTMVLSQHSSDEEYLGQRPLELTDNKEVQQKFEKFNKVMKDIEKKISERNANPKLKNRRGIAKIPYELLYPDTSNDGSRGGITGKGIPNSISI